MSGALRRKFSAVKVVEKYCTTKSGAPRRNFSAAHVGEKCCTTKSGAPRRKFSAVKVVEKKVPLRVVLLEGIFPP